MNLYYELIYCVGIFPAGIYLSLELENVPALEVSYYVILLDFTRALVHK